ncbi:kinesin-like protein KIF20B [Pleurodeles waltl]
MESLDDLAAHYRPSFIEGDDAPKRFEQVYADDIKANLSEKFALVSSSSDLNSRTSLDPKDHLKVFLRVRPFTAAEIEQKESQDCVQIEDSTSVLLKAPSNSLAIRLSDKGYTQMIQKFTFSHIFGPETSQKEFFEGTVKELVNDFLDGRNRLIFTYGVSNSGKTYTFQGTPDHHGILPRSMNMLFSSIQNKHYTKMDLKPHRCRDYVRLTKDQVKKEITIKNAVLRLTKEVESQSGGPCLESMDSIEGSLQTSIEVSLDPEEPAKEPRLSDLNLSTSVRFSIWVSFCEIYNECIYDLLEPISSNKFQKRKTLRLAQDIKGCSFVKDLQWIEVSDSKEAYKLLHLGKRCQSFASTKLNSSSSRSHSIFTFRMLRIEDAEIPRVTKVSELSLCDLAGSERCTKTRNEGDRLKESGNINTSLHILGKCINALKNNQQAKLPQHVPFRESKLTHYLQSFFCGKGKACMIVNISQAASVYDETLNVLKFSAVAQKVLLLDTSKPPPVLPFGVSKTAMDVSLLMDNADNKSWSSRRRATILWDSRLDDVIESEDEDMDSEEETEDQDPEASPNDQTLEEEVVKKEESNIILAEKEYQQLLDLIEDLRKKLVNETKQNLFMEMKIRKEIAKEFTEQLVQRDSDFSESLKKERELLEERSDERLAIFQDLVSKCTKEQESSVEEITAESSSLHATAKDEDGCVPIEAFIDSMQEDLVGIKERAVAAHLHIKAIPGGEDIERLQKRLAELTAALSQTQEELRKKTQEVEMHVTNFSRCTAQLEEAAEKIAKQSSRIEELMCIVNEKDNAVAQLQELLSHWEDKFENYDKTVRHMKGEMLCIHGGGIRDSIQSCGPSVGSSDARKRPAESRHMLEEQPPAKKGNDQKLSIISGADDEKSEILQHNFPDRGATLTELEGKLKATQNRIVELTDELQGERAGNEELRSTLSSMQHSLSSSEEKALGLSKEVQQITSKCEKIISEFQAQKEINKEQGEKISKLLAEVESNKLNISDKLSQIQNIQVKMDLLSKDETEMKTLDLENSTHSCSASTGENTLPDASVNADGRSSAFHSAIECLWKECQHLVKVSSKKSCQIKKLEEQLLSLKEDTEGVKTENSQLKLKLSEVENLGKLQNEEKTLTEHLRKQLLETNILLEFEKKNVVEVTCKLTELEKQKSSYEDKLLELDCFVKTIKDKNESLEEQILQKKSAFEELQQRYQESEKMVRSLTDKEIALKDELAEIKNKLIKVQVSLGEEKRQEEIRKQEIEQLKKELSDSCAREQTLKLDLERKNEDYSDLKEKLSDAKKQIQQVEKEVSAMREEKKMMSIKINEFEKLKNQMSLDSEMKQRTIQLLKKEQVDNEKNEVIQKYCADLKAKEKIIEDMRLTLLEQEQTQVEQDQALEAKTEEVTKLASELEEWKHSCRVLENIKLSHECHQIANEKNDLNNPTIAELSKLQEELKDCEEKHNAERKKWMEEKMGLISQAKEAETLRNREMRKFAEDRERHFKQQTDIETLTAQLSEKDKDLQKWREERDQLVAALEVQLRNLVSCNLEKDKEIEQLKGNLVRAPEVESEKVIKDFPRIQAAHIKKTAQDLHPADNFKAITSPALRSMNVLEAKELVSPKKAIEEQTQNRKMPAPSVPSSGPKTQILTKDDSSSQFSELSSIDESGDNSDVVLDSSALSTENGKTSRFPKPQLEIQFTPLTPNKMEVKHQGSASPVTVKINRPLRKRKSHEMEEGIVKTENKKNATRSADTHCSASTPVGGNQKGLNKGGSVLKKQISTSSTSSAKKDGTLQKIGDFLHSSPSIFHSKAKKLIETMSSVKPVVDESTKENQCKPKRSRRKLYTTDISAPMDIPSNPIIMDKNTKESDHLIMKRRLRAKTGK